MITIYIYVTIMLAIYFVLSEFFRIKCKSIKDLNGNVPYMIILGIFGAFYIDIMWDIFEDAQGRIYAVVGLLVFVGIMEITGLGRKMGYSFARDWFLSGFKFKFGERVSFIRDNKTVTGELVRVKKPKDCFGIKKDDGEIAIFREDELEFLRHLDNN